MVTPERGILTLLLDSLPTRIPLLAATALPQRRHGWANQGRLHGREKEESCPHNFRNGIY